MKEVICYGNSLPEAYHKSLKFLQESEIVPCPDWNTNQKEISATLVINYPLAENMISKLFIGDPFSLEQYRQEMLDGILDFEITKGNWDYTYHDRMTNYPVRKISLAGVYEDFSLNQVDFVIHELKRNPYSRRAVIDIRNNVQDCGSNDPACWQHAQFFIRDNKLHMKVLFRSNDACKAAFMNAFALIMLQERIAKELNVEIGTYTHRANSYHCYERDFEMLDGYVKRIEESNLEDLTYSYEDDWKDLMEEYQDEIAAKVANLKK